MNERRLAHLLGDEFAAELRAMQQTQTPERPVDDGTPDYFQPLGVSDAEVEQALRILSREGTDDFAEVSEARWAQALEEARGELAEGEPEAQIISRVSHEYTTSREDELDRAAESISRRLRELAEAKAEARARALTGSPRRTYTFEIVDKRPGQPDRVRTIDRNIARWESVSHKSEAIRETLAEIKRAEKNQANEENESDV